jgi:hypothetical protein
MLTTSAKPSFAWGMISDRGRDASAAEQPVGLRAQQRRCGHRRTSWAEKLQCSGKAPTPGEVLGAGPSEVNAPCRGADLAGCFDNTAFPPERVRNILKSSKLDCSARAVPYPAMVRVPESPRRALFGDPGGSFTCSDILD